MFKRIKAWQDNIVGGLGFGLFGAPVPVPIPVPVPVQQSSQPVIESEHHTVTDTGLKYGDYLRLN